MHRHGASRPHDLRATMLRDIAASRGASVRLIDLEPYEPCRVIGVVERLRIDPCDGYIEAAIADETGEVAARWFTSSPAPELAAMIPGRVVVLVGMAVRGDGGRLILEDPAFETIDSPEVA